MKNLVALIFVLFFSFISSAQNSTVVDSLLAKIEISNDTSKVLLYIDLLRIYETSVPDSALMFGEKALNISQDIGFENGIAKSYNEIGIVHHSLGNVKSAIENFKKSLVAHTALGNSIMVASISNNLGYSYYLMGDFPLALDYYYNALSLYEDSNEFLRVALLKGNMGIIYFAIDEYDKAKELYSSAINLLENTEYKDYLATTYGNMGDLCRNQDSLILAVDYYQKALKLHTESNNLVMVADDLYKIGTISLDVKEYKKADSLLNESLILSNRLGDKINISKCYDKIGESYLKQEKYIKAIDYFQKSIESGKNTSVNMLMVSPHLNSAIAFEKLMEYELALEHYKLAVAFRDSIFSEQKSKNLKELEIKYETEKNELQIDFQQKLLTKRYTLLVIFSIGSFVLIVLLLSLIILYRKLKKSNLLLVQQKKELAKKQKEVIKVNKELDELNTLKDKMFAVLAHDLRSPLNIFKEILSVFMDGITDAKMLQKQATEIHGIVNSTCNLIDNLLNWAVIKVSKEKIKNEVIDVSALIEENISLLRTASSKKKIKIINNIRSSELVIGDPNMVNLIFRNLLTNAVKFTPEDGQIKINCKSVKKKIEISIVDTGIGMSKNQLNNLFKGPADHTSVGTAGEKGAGLGLSLCYDFLTMNKQKIWVESEENIGTTFNFTLSKA